MNSGLDNALGQVTETAHQSQGITVSTFLASISTAVVLFAVQVVIFILLKSRKNFRSI